MRRCVAIAGFCALSATTAANAQFMTVLGRSEPPVRHPPPLDFRLIEEPSANRVDPASRGVRADTEVAPNARIGFQMMTISRPKLGPEWRVDGRSIRSRKPAVSFSLRF